MTLSLEDKRKITARNFFTDQIGTEDAYENYEEALSEIQQVPEEFCNTVLRAMPLEKEGYRTLMKDGYVINVNPETGHVLPVSEMTEEDGQKIQTEFQNTSLVHPEITSAVVLMQQMGWKVL